MKTDRPASEAGLQRPPDRAATRADGRPLEPAPNELAGLAMDVLCELDAEALRLLANAGC
jgi:hypothetical protein